MVFEGLPCPVTAANNCAAYLPSLHGLKVCVCRQPNIVYVLEALTPKACQEDISYERVELLGDAFLKYAVSLFLFHKLPEAHEGISANYHTFSLPSSSSACSLLLP